MLFSQQEITRVLGTLMPGTRTIAYHSSVGTVGGTAALYVGKVPTRPLERPGGRWSSELRTGMVTYSWELLPYGC